MNANLKLNQNSIAVAELFDQVKLASMERVTYLEYSRALALATAEILLGAKSHDPEVYRQMQEILTAEGKDLAEANGGDGQIVTGIGRVADTTRPPAGRAN